MASSTIDHLDANNIFNVFGATDYIPSYNNNSVNISNLGNSQALAVASIMEPLVSLPETNKDDLATSSSRPTKQAKTRAIMPKQKPAELHPGPSPNERDITNGAAGSPKGKAGRITTIACMECQRKKCKCDGVKPRCRACERKGVKQCIYQDRDDTSRSLKEKTKSQQDEIMKLRKQVEELQKELGRPVTIREKSNQFAEDLENNTTDTQINDISPLTDALSTITYPPVQPSSVNIGKTSYPLDVSVHAAAANQWQPFTGMSEDIEGYARASQNASTIHEPFAGILPLQTPIPGSSLVDGSMSGHNANASMSANTRTGSKKRTIEESSIDPQISYDKQIPILQDNSSFFMMPQTLRQPYRDPAVPLTSGSSATLPSASTNDFRQSQQWPKLPQQSSTYQSPQGQQSKQSQRQDGIQAPTGFPFPPQSRDMTPSETKSDQGKYIDQMSKFERFKRGQSDASVSPSHEPGVLKKKQDEQKPQQQRQQAFQTPSQQFAAQQQHKQIQTQQARLRMRQAKQSQPEQGQQSQGQPQQGLQRHAPQHLQHDQHQGPHPPQPHDNERQNPHQIAMQPNSQQNLHQQVPFQFRSPQYFQQVQAQQNSQPQQQQQQHLQQQQSQQVPQMHEQYYSRHILLNGNNALNFGDNDFAQFQGREQYNPGNMTLAPMMEPGSAAGPRIPEGEGYSWRDGV